MKMTIELSQGIVEKWCDENGFELIKMYEDGDSKPLSKGLIQYEGINGIIDRVCKHTGISKTDIHKKTRQRKIVEVRQLAHKIAHKHSGDSLAVIGYEIGRKDHATVLNSVKKINNLMETCKLFNRKYDELIKLYRL